MSELLKKNANELLQTAGKFNKREVSAFAEGLKSLSKFMDSIWLDPMKGGFDDAAEKIVTEMQTEAMVNGKGWAKRAKINDDRETRINQYATPGNFVSLRDQLKGSSPNAKAFWEKVREVYNESPLSQDLQNILHEARKTLGADFLDQKLGINAQPPVRRAGLKPDGETETVFKVNWDGPNLPEPFQRAAAIATILPAVAPAVKPEVLTI